MVNPAKVEDFHRLKTSNGSKKVIIKLSKRKDAAKKQSSKKKLKGMELSSLGIRDKVCINGNPCKYYKLLWKKCKSLHSNHFIHAFWVSNGTVLLKVVENGRVHVVHLSDLKDLFLEKQVFREKD